MTTADLLADLGHEVVEADTAQAGLRALAQGADVLMVDFGLPDMDGRDSRGPGAAASARHSGRHCVRPQRCEPGGPQALPGTPPVWLSKPYDGDVARRSLGPSLRRYAVRPAVSDISVAWSNGSPCCPERVSAVRQMDETHEASVIRIGGVHLLAILPAFCGGRARPRTPKNVVAHSKTITRNPATMRRRTDEKHGPNCYRCRLTASGV